MKKSNPQAIITTSVPKVLPIVSDAELEEEESRIRKRTESPATMPITHIQYNDPISIYSNENVNEALNQAVGIPTQ